MNNINNLPPFKSEPSVNFSLPGEIEHFKDALTNVRTQLGKTYPLVIGGKEVPTDRKIPSLNPNNISEVLGYVCFADKSHSGDAIAAAKEAFPLWRDTPPAERAHILLKAAQILRKRIYQYAAWQILEVGKQWDQAYGDVTEAIDFLEYYAREMLRLANPLHLGALPGESNTYFYEPKGVSLVIAPWNFPLAISVGMVSAALVTGNTVVYKPSELSSIVGYQVVEVFKDAGLPQGVLSFLPGYGYEIGDYLVEHHDVSTIAFTGSKETGLRILEKASKVHPHQAHIKKVVCEMGGKNAIIIDDDADLDQAIPLILHSAFAFQGQKCSACSRLIVLDEIYDRTIDRLVKAAKDLQIGPSEDPAYYFGAVVDANAKEKILKYQEIAMQEGKILYKSPVPPANGYWVPMMIVENINPSHRIAQEEVFGPLLAIMRVKDFAQAIDWANSTSFALTGSVFSRSPKNLEHAAKRFHVGNLYLNRGCTGALVGRQAFGGAFMSGGGTKAGGPDYLLNFMYPRVVTENTIRRGFSPNLKTS